VFEYIEVFYNRIRHHAKIGNQIPAKFANQFYASRQQSAALSGWFAHPLGAATSKRIREEWKRTREGPFSFGAR
jgi:hypothetical protein